MNKFYKIKFDGVIIGETKFEKADPPMGVVYGEIINSSEIINYEFIKSFCKKNKIELASDYPEDKLISTRTIKQLKIISPQEIEINWLGNQITGMDGEGYQITIEGIGYPLYQEEFPHHIKEYNEKFKEEEK